MHKRKILFVSNVSIWGGSVKSLHQTITALKKESVFIPFLMIPHGSASKHFESVTEVLNVSAIPQFDNTLYGHYRGFRWLLLLRETYALFRFLFSLLGIKKRYSHFDIIHFNEIVCFLPCVHLLKKIYPEAKIITHVRSLQSDKKGLRNKCVKSLLENCADHIFCIDKIVANTLPESLLKKVTVLYNISDSDSACQHLSIRNDRKIKLIFLGGSSYMKGAGFLTTLLSILDDMNVVFSLTVLGIEEETPSFAAKVFNMILSWLGIKKSLSKKDFIGSFNIFQPKFDIQLLSFQKDINLYLKSSDVLIFPSYLDAPGRPSIEAMGYGIPSVIFCNDKDNDVVLEGVTGYNVPNRDLHLFADRIAYFYRNPDVLSTFRNNCLKHYNERFLSSSHLQILSGGYNNLLFNDQLINK